MRRKNDWGATLYKIELLKNECDAALAEVRQIEVDGDPASPKLEARLALLALTQRMLAKWEFGELDGN